MKHKIVQKQQITTVYVNKEIKTFCKQNKINLSKWINQTFIKQYLSIESKINLINLKYKEIEEIKVEVKQIKQNCLEALKTLTIREKQYIQTVPKRLTKGANMNSIKDCFNNTFKRNLSLEQFQQIIYPENDQKQLKSGEN